MQKTDEKKIRVNLTLTKKQNDMLKLVADRKGLRPTTCARMMLVEQVYKAKALFPVGTKTEEIDRYHQYQDPRYLNKEPQKGVCKICGCTDEDCSECIKETGVPCHWIDEDHTLCSRCAENIENTKNRMLDDIMPK